MVLDLSFQYGISKDHARQITITLADNERTRLNLGGDVAYFSGYVRDLQSRTKGAAPKL